MITFTERQQELVDSDYMEVTWRFVVEEADTTQYLWSTMDADAIGAYGAFSFKVIDFPGIVLRRSAGEAGIQAPNELNFTVENKDNALTAADFEGGRALVLLCLDDGAGEEIIRSWHFHIKKATPTHQKIEFFCEDFIQQYLKGDYPDTRLVDNIFPSDDQKDKDNLCVPVPFGTSYIPLRSVYITDQRYYLLGLAANTYDITAVHSPNEMRKSEWTSGSYTFTQSTEQDADSVNWRVFQPIIADSDSDGTVDACGLFRPGAVFLDMPTRFTRNDTETKTSPADVIEFILEDFGIPDADIDSTSFTSAKSTYTSWGLTFNGAFYYKKSKLETLSQLLTMCNSILVIGEKIELHVLSADSVKTITDADVLRTNERGEPALTYDDISDETESDSGYAAFQETGKPQDKLIKILVPAKASFDYPSGDILEMPFVQNSQDVQKAACLHLQRKYLKKANVDFSSKPKLLALCPDDVITLSDADYGGTYPVLVDSITINENLQLDFSSIRFKGALEDWEDLSFSPLTVDADDTTNVWQTIIVGPDSTLTGAEIPNLLTGRLRIGATPNHIILDPAVPIIKLVEGATNRVLIDGANTRIRSSNYVSGVTGAGFTLEPDLLEVGNIACRGIIRCAVFQKDVVSAVGGNLAVLPADLLNVNMTADDDDDDFVRITEAGDSRTTEVGDTRILEGYGVLTLEGNETLAAGDILRIKDGTNDEWMEVALIDDAPIYAVIRDMAGDYADGANPAWEKGASVVNYRQSGDGGIYLTASETNAPYLSMFTHAGAPWTTITTQTRLGNLNGSYGYGSDIYGMGIGQYGVASKNWITVEQTNGIRMGTNTTVFSQWDLSGNVLIGQTGAGQSNIYITSGAISLRNNVTDVITISSAGVVGITVKSGGHITLERGGDIVLTPHASSPAEIVFGNIHFGSVNVNTLEIWHDDSESGYFYIGYDPAGGTPTWSYLKSIIFRVHTEIEFLVFGDVNNWGKILIQNDGDIFISAQNGGDAVQGVQLAADDAAFYPVTTDITDLGNTTHKWKTLWVKNFAVVYGGIHIGSSADPGTDNLRVDGTFKMMERAAADAETALYGQIWIKNTTPCELWFTDDAGTDTKIV